MTTAKGFTDKQLRLHQRIGLTLLKNKKYRASRAFDKVAIYAVGDTHMPDGAAAKPTPAEFRLCRIIWAGVVRALNDEALARRAEDLGYHAPAFEAAGRHRADIARRFGG